MKLRYLGLPLILVLTVISPSAKPLSRSDESWRSAKPKTVTLFSRARYKDKSQGYGKSAFSFNHGLRSDSGPRITGNNYELLYGSICWNRDCDWFSVTMVADDHSRIKDLGELKWSDPFEVPDVPPNPEWRQGIRWPAKNETLEQSSKGQVTKVVAGHIYVLRSKDSQSDLYTLFRVEKLVPNDQVTISWKVVRRQSRDPRNLREPGVFREPSIFREPRTYP